MPSPFRTFLAGGCRRAAATAALACAVSAASAQVTNAPVAPDAIYVLRGGDAPGVSVIDLNGFGQSTGSPAFDFTYQSFPEGSSNFPNNPNVKLQGSSLHPPLAPGVTTFDGGSAGVFTLTRNAHLDDLLLGAPTVSGIADAMLGHPLDSTFHAGTGAEGCSVGQGHACASSASKLVEVAFAANGTAIPAQFGGAFVQSVPGGENPISWAPHPNPPGLAATPACLVPFVGSDEPTSILSVNSGFMNLLAPGDPLGDPLLGIPPTGLLARKQNTWFVGPSRPSDPNCLPFALRQKVGHFLYLADRARGELVVADSNTMRLVARIAVEDPTELAMSPNLDLLAVSQHAHDQVSFVSIDPQAASFHQVVKVVAVGDGPRGVAWDPGNEDVLVCNEGSDSVSVISAAALAVRKELGRGFTRPFGVAITQRQAGFGFQRNVYFAYVLNRDGHVTLIESGPDGVNGWGYDDAIWRTPYPFPDARAIQPDPLRLSSGVWIAHQQQLGPDGTPTGLGGGAVSNLVIDSAITGKLPLNATNAGTPQLRSMSLRIEASIGSDELTGIPLDLAFDDQVNLGALPNLASAFGAGTPVPLNGKSQARALPSGGFAPTQQSALMFVPVARPHPDREAVDVVDLLTLQRRDTNAHHPGIQSIPVSGAARTISYFRQ